MSDFYVGEIRMFAGVRVPINWHWCDGSLLNIENYQTLYSLLGTTYGGNGVTTFALPDLRSRTPIGMGPQYPVAAQGGTETVTLAASELPLHTHTINASSAAGTTSVPGPTTVWANGGTLRPYATPANSSQLDTTLATAALAIAPGGNGAHNNMMPSLGMNFMIALNGIYPSFGDNSDTHKDHHKKHKKHRRHLDIDKL